MHDPSVSPVEEAAHVEAVEVHAEVLPAHVEAPVIRILYPQIAAH